MTSSGCLELVTSGAGILGWLSPGHEFADGQFGDAAHEQSCVGGAEQDLPLQS
jgi:hypothetical protein